jgi:hypothetical protein
MSLPHKFKLHQNVRLARYGYADALADPANVYEVVRLLPADQTGEPTYRIKSGSAERAVRESEIRSV